MKKLKFFFSLRKEQDYLEEMARKGWLLTNISCGILYHFKESEPCEKVFEIERFAITAHPTVADLTARIRAFDITSQFGWEPVTHDEDMNYYFMKDKAGDETDEFYDDTESRIERAERYRRHYCIEQPRQLAIELLLLSLLYLFVFWLLKDDATSTQFLMWVYIIITIIIVTSIYGIMVCGQHIYTELCMSRTEWTEHKKHNEKKRFTKVQQLRSFLQEKSEFGLSLKGYENGYYMFEKDSQRYNYFIDTKTCLKKRLKEDGVSFTDDKKDFLTQSLKWYEISIANAAKYDLKPVATVGKSILIYKRPFSEKSMPWENGNENIRFGTPGRTELILTVCCLIIGIIFGFIASSLLR